MDSNRPASSPNAWPWAACRTMGYGWLQCHASTLPLSPAVLNSGVAGMVAFVAAAAWYAALHAPASLARLASQ